MAMDTIIIYYIQLHTDLAASKYSSQAEEDSNIAQKTIFAFIC